MYKKRMIRAIIMVVCFMTACAQKPVNEERRGIRVAVGDSAYEARHMEEDGAESPLDDVKPVWNDKSVPNSSSPENEPTGDSDHSSGWKVSDLP